MSYTACGYTIVSYQRNSERIDSIRMLIHNGHTPYYFYT